MLWYRHEDSQVALRGATAEGGGMKPSDKRIRPIVAAEDLVCFICREKIPAGTQHVLIRRPDRPDGRRVHVDAHRSCAEKDLELSLGDA